MKYIIALTLLFINSCAVICPAADQPKICSVDTKAMPTQSAKITKDLQKKAGCK